MTKRHAKHNALIDIWLELNFGLTDDVCQECDGFDPLEFPALRKVYNIRGGLCLEHILKKFAGWVNAKDE